ncbi:MAG: LOG family protein [Candidatus Chisholmbacteria bacterium]|nr:LOG family protein [Candidatus Chisholmbacteria bacterium]
MIKNVAFFGYADAKPETELYQQAFATAKLLAQHGYTIVNGGGPGVMHAATQGAEAAGGETLAVTFSPKDAPGFEGRYVLNVVDREIKTANYIERMFKLLEHSQTFVIFKGGTGTISEFGTAWVLARLYYGHHKPFILYGDFWHEVIGVLTKHMMMRGAEEKVFEIVNEPHEVLEAIKRFDQELTGFDHGKHCQVCEGLVTPANV